MFLSAVGLSLTLAYLCVHMPTCPRQAMRLSHLREVRPALACGQLNENAGQGDVGPKPHQAVVAITPGRPQRAAFDANEVQGELAECEPMRRAACVNRPPAFATKTGLRVFEAGRSRGWEAASSPVPRSNCPLAARIHQIFRATCLSMKWLPGPIIALESRVLRLQPWAAVSDRGFNLSPNPVLPGLFGQPISVALFENADDGIEQHIAPIVNSIATEWPSDPCVLAATSRSSRPILIWLRSQRTLKL
jgi:hypothetical protein